MLLVPPRHGKSELASRRFPAWYLGRHPDQHFISASARFALAEDFGRDVRNLMKSEEYAQIFDVQLAEDSQARGRWNTAQGGSYYAVGVGGALFGRNEAGYVEGQNVTVEYHWLEGRYDRLPALVADLVRRRVAVIATPGDTQASLSAKAATATIPIVFGVGEDPVRLGLVANLARPGGNATGINFFPQELMAKRLGLLHDLVPKAARIAVLVNPTTPTAEATLRDIPEAARAIGLQIQLLNASTSREIETAFATIVRDWADALFLAPDAFFASRRGQFVTLAARDRMPTSCGNRDMVEAGLLMSYGTKVADMFR